ncbi:MAG: HlyC/CorC family transporter [Parvularculales bacterium]
MTTLFLITTGGAIIFLMGMSAFFSGSETALTAVSRARMHRLAAEGNLRAQTVNTLIYNREQLIGAILLGNNLTNILASALATSVFLTLFGAPGVAYATIIMTALVVIFAEVLPKTWAISRADDIALWLAPAVKLVVRLFSPVAAVMTYAATRALRLVGAEVHNQPGQVSADEELRGTIDLHHQEGRVVKDSRDMIGGILDLKAVEVNEVMVHRKNMAMADADLAPADLVNQVLAGQHSRIPLWRDEPENVIGTLHARDLLDALVKSGGDINALDIPSLTRKPWFVPETISLQNQLDAFLRRKSHFAFVIDEYGGLMGLVTLEDILEEIVGNISDEHDIDIRGVRPQPNGSVNVDGNVTIRDLNRAMDWSLPDEEATTVAGLVIHEAHVIPDAGQMFTFHDFRFEILRRHRNQITALRITPQQPDQ